MGGLWQLYSSIIYILLLAYLVKHKSKILKKNKNQQRWKKLVCKYLSSMGEQEWRESYQNTCSHTFITPFHSKERANKEIITKRCKWYATATEYTPWILWGTWSGSCVIGIPQVRSVCDFSISLMEHLERSSATSAEFCTALSEYNTHGLQVQPLYQTRQSKIWIVGSPTEGFRRKHERHPKKGF